MAIPRDWSFVREGRGLHEWLPELSSASVGTRNRAGSAVIAMYQAVPSGDTDHAEMEITARSAFVSHEGAFVREVELACARPEFPRRAFAMSSAAFLTGAHADFMKQMQATDPQYERILDKLDVRLDLARSEEARAAHFRRLGRALCASIARDERRQENEPLPVMISEASMALSFALKGAGPAFLEAPEALWMLLESKGTHHHAVEMLERLGPRATGLFLGYFLEQLSAGTSDGCYNDVRATGVLARGSLAGIRTLLDLTAHHSDRVAQGAYWALGHVGPKAAECPEAVPVLRQRLRSRRGLDRANAPGALAAIAPDAEGLIETLLELTRDEDWTVVAGAIESLGRLARQPALVVPRLIELLDAYEEVDCDEGYHGDHARVCRALSAFGPAAAPAVPRLIELLREAFKEGESFNGNDLVETLGAIGPAASAALPLIDPLARENGELDPDDAFTCAAKAIRGETRA